MDNITNSETTMEKILTTAGYGGTCATCILITVAIIIRFKNNVFPKTLSDSLILHWITSLILTVGIILYKLDISKISAYFLIFGIILKPITSTTIHCILLQKIYSKSPSTIFKSSSKASRIIWFTITATEIVISAVVCALPFSGIIYFESDSEYRIDPIPIRFKPEKSWAFSAMLIVITTIFAVLSVILNLISVIRSVFIYFSDNGKAKNGKRKFIVLIITWTILLFENVLNFIYFTSLNLYYFSNGQTIDGLEILNVSSVISLIVLFICPLLIIILLSILLSFENKKLDDCEAVKYQSLLPEELLTVSKLQEVSSKASLFPVFFSFSLNSSFYAFYSKTRRGFKKCL